MVNNRRTENMLKLLIGLVLVVILNQLVAKFPMRFDLTDEKRFSISKASESLLKNLDDVVYIEVYLDGELPSGFKRLKKSIKETLEEYAYYAGDNIEYKFIDPSIAKSTKARNEFYQSIAQKGIRPTNLAFNKDGNKTDDKTPVI